MEQAKKKGQPRFGAVWRPETGKLVEWMPGGVLVTRPWPAPRAWVKLDRQAAWREVLPQVPHIARSVYEHEHGGSSSRTRRIPTETLPRTPIERARAEAWATVPLEIRALIFEIEPNGGRTLSLLARVPAARALAESVPALAYALAHAPRFRPIARPLDAARRLLAGPDGAATWRRVLAWLGFDPSPSMLEHFRAMRSQLPSLKQLLDLRRIDAHPLGRKRLRHAHAQSGASIGLLATALDRGFLDQLHPDLVAEAERNGAYSGVRWSFERLLDLSALVRPGKPLPRVRTPDELEAAVDRLRAEGRRTRGLTAAGELPFPEPPLPGDDVLTPIASPEALGREGFEMRHCLGNGTWDREARARLGFAYAAVLGGERATAWISRAEGFFTLTQLRGPGNSVPSPALERHARAWLERQRAAFEAGRPLPADWTRPPPSLTPEEAALLEEPEIPF